MVTRLLTFEEAKRQREVIPTVIDDEWEVTQVHQNERHLQQPMIPAKFLVIYNNRHSTFVSIPIVLHKTQATKDTNTLQDGCMYV